MTLNERVEIVGKISHTIAIMMCEMELHQSMNVYALNIHAEDYYCGVFNFLYVGKSFKNANSAGANQEFIDLIDENSKHVIQVTTTTTKDKIDNTLKLFINGCKQYAGYDFDVFYLLRKPRNLKKTTIEQYRALYGIKDIRNHLKDFTDLIDDIKSLTDLRLNEIFNRFFRRLSETYTEEISLQIVFDLLVKNNQSKNRDYSEDFNNIELDAKIKLNNLNRIVSSKLHEGSEASLPIYENIDDGVLTEIRDLVVNRFYVEALKNNLLHAGARHKDIARKSISELHELTIDKYKINYSKVLGDLCHRIENETFKANYQETSMAWVIISYFFEECDIGIKE